MVKIEVLHEWRTAHIQILQKFRKLFFQKCFFFISPPKLHLLFCLWDISLLEALTLSFMNIHTGPHPL